ncbi:hypothetical protein FCM35_KLT17661 [Carex littledalei]|uniref:Uncharacterized protein n=1 Tax=Carex littledalei TaxID=544730 RepID=A0A833R8N3_9POAL|nr:hypothetical protein FCM35_KLT17661 [Carex littledalei]
MVDKADKEEQSALEVGKDGTVAVVGSFAGIVQSNDREKYYMSSPIRPPELQDSTTTNRQRREKSIIGSTRKKAKEAADGVPGSMGD